MDAALLALAEIFTTQKITTLTSKFCKDLLWVIVVSITLQATLPIVIFTINSWHVYIQLLL